MERVRAGYTAEKEFHLSLNRYEVIISLLFWIGRKIRKLKTLKGMKVGIGTVGEKADLFQELTVINDRLIYVNVIE